MPLIRISRNPTGRQLVVFASAWLVFLACAGALGWLRGRHQAAQALWILAFVVPLSGAVSPAAVKFAYLGLSYATYPIGYVVSHAVLAIVYFLVLTPIGLAMRLLGRDPLKREFKHGERSYWRPVDKFRPVDSYFKQY